MEVIHVGLYGGKSIFGGRETPQRAELISCDRFQQCSYYKNNQCLNVTVPFGTRCKYGKINVEHGYTSRAKKHYDFDHKYKTHEKYHKLNHPPTKLGLIGEDIVFPYPFIVITTKENVVRIEGPGLGSSIAYIPIEQFTIDLIHRICTFKPRALTGGIIKKYQSETAPLFLAHLKEILPDKYAEYAKKHGLTEKEINYIGRKALLKTIKPSDVLYESRNYPNLNEKWYWDGEVLAYKSGHVSGFNVTKDYKIAEIKLIPSDNSTVTISDNEQVSEKTVFID